MVNYLFILTVMQSFKKLFCRISSFIFW